MRNLTTMAALTALLCLAAPATASSQAQDLDRDCNPTSPPPSCQRLGDSVRSLESRIESQQARLEGASPAMKPGIIRNITNLTRQRDEAQAELRRCLGDYRAGLRQLAAGELNSTFRGTARIVTTKLAGVFTQDFRMGIRFTRSRCSFTITSLNNTRPETHLVPGVGSLTVTVEETNGRGVGDFHPVSGAMSVPVTIRYTEGTYVSNHRSYTTTTELRFVLNSSDSNWIDGARVVGRPVAADGSVTLNGRTSFMGVPSERPFYPTKYDAWLTVAGTLDPRP